MKKFGFGCMRLPKVGEEIDIPQFCQMVDRFLEAGFTYFDTAHGYHGGKSETSIKEALTSRHPRDSYLLTNKLTATFFNSEEEIRPFFQNQLEWCGVEYFDNYLMHALNAKNYEKFKACNAFNIAAQLKAEGKIRRVGMSFHDTAEVLDKILSEQPVVEIVQIQFNYADYEDTKNQSRACLEVCRKHGKPVIVMEPVRGGALANLPEEAAAILAELKGGSQASYAIRFAASFEGVEMVLSGMSDMAQLEENCSFMADFKPLDETEMAAVWKVCEVFNAQGLIPCTACKYCVDGCPMKINIPGMFYAYNDQKRFRNVKPARYEGLTKDAGKASDCIGCGQCTAVCPQRLIIPDLLDDVAKTFEQ